MTDIQRQIVPLIKQLDTALVDSPPRLDEGRRMGIQALIREMLPSGYGVATGYVIGPGNQTSALLDIIIYDQPLSGDVYEDSSRHFKLEHVLAVVCYSPCCDRSMLGDVLARVASLKQMCPQHPAGRFPEPSRSPGLFGAKIPRFRLPVALAVFRDLMPRMATEEDTYTFLREMLDRIELAQRPDYLTVTQSGVGYRNPFLDSPIPEPQAIGLSRLPDLHRPSTCYVCDQTYHRRHFFYDMLCQKCGDLNYSKRSQSADLRGRIALVTGARVKIGYAVALKLLRAGTFVIATTRFPHDAARRFALEPDFNEWGERLHIYGLDMRYLTGIQAFIGHLYEAYPHMDILINNAAQTVRRPPAYYAHLMPGERKNPDGLSPEIRRLLPPVWRLPSHASLPTGNQKALWLPGGADDALHSSAELSQIPILPEDDALSTPEFPHAELDTDGQQVDRRSSNSWVMRFDDVSLPELLEVQLINVMAPTMLLNGLKDLMLRSSQPDRYIVNVSSVEGQFAQAKAGYHPHTNMAKAALNMLTYSVAGDYAECGIYMNAVDPGWISHQVPNASEEIEKRRVDLPLDTVDAAARICDPIFVGVQTGDYVSGKLLKDYTNASW